MGYIENLIENCEKAKRAIPIQEFELRDLSQLDTVKKAIYIIEEVRGDHKDTFIGFSVYKKTKDRSCSKLNSPSPVMYVGSSTTNVKNRIEQHLGNGSKGTYSLHLKHWFKGNYKIRIKVYDEPIEVLQIVEDDLSHRLQPAFGKKGGNNR